jgi:site-specific recombinase XerD
LLSTGARISEVLRLNRSDWNPHPLRLVGKGDRERTVQVTDKTQDAVEEYLAAPAWTTPYEDHWLAASRGV